jgi:hypothetical protein
LIYRFEKSEIVEIKAPRAILTCGAVTHVNQWKYKFPDLYDQQIVEVKFLLPFYRVTGLICRFWFWEVESCMQSL